MQCSERKHIKSAKKPHWCNWCGHEINIGEGYSRWRCWDSGDTGTCRVHFECEEAMDEAYSDDPFLDEFYPGSNPRGCNCGFDRDCERCKTRKEKQNE